MLLEKWLDSIPDELRLPTSGRVERIVPSHILSLHAFHCFILILLHRPWFAAYDPSASDPGPDGSVAKCERAAAKVLSILQLWRRCPGLRYSPITLGQVAFSAGTVHLLSASHCASKQSRKFKACIEAVQQCITALREMGETLKCAAVSANTLQKLLDESYAPAPPKPAPAPAPAPGPEGLDIASMLQNPAVAEQLLKMGWAPPSGVSIPSTAATAAGSSTTSTPVQPAPATNGASNGGGSSFGVDWTLFGQLQSHPLPSLPGTGLQMPAMHGGPGSSSAPGEQGTNIYDVLYAGASETPFPSGNAWAWPFGATDGAGVGL